jgi:hypothetical protein
MATGFHRAKRWDGDVKTAGHPVVLHQHVIAVCFWGMDASDLDEVLAQ